jgi:uncharacterized UBP type Zn finger protein
MYIYISNQESFNYANRQASSEMRKKTDIQCVHIDKVNPKIRGNTKGCEECEKIGSSWVHLRLCLTCGHVGCCDSSPNKHGTKHFKETEHPVIKSYEPGEDWKWCHIDEIFLKK